MSTALYRRYRPETFTDVIGQEHVTEPLMQALRTGRVNHAYLFSGPRGCGKTTSARILARCLNCERGPTATPCGQCDSCVALARRGAGTVDVIEIDAASHGGVDDARDLRERASYGPAQSRYKIYIIDEAHMVTPQGFNALLKIVEEPPEHVKFVFATTEPEKVIGTIRSRTHHYPFRLVPPARLTAYMAQLCDKEGVTVAPGVLGFVTRAGGGSVRDSLSVLDQLIAGSGEEGLTYEGAAALLGFTDGELLDATIDALAAADGAAVFTQIDRVIESGHDPRRFVEDLLERLRDLIIVAAVPEGAASVLRGVPEDQLDRMRGQQSRFGRGALSRAADIVNTGLTEMTGATAPRLQLELICARILLPAASGESGYAARLDRLERRLELGGTPTAARGAVGPGQPSTAQAPQPEPAPVAEADARSRGGAAPPAGSSGTVVEPPTSAAGPRETSASTPSGEVNEAAAAGSGPGTDSRSANGRDSGPAAVPDSRAATGRDSAPGADGADNGGTDTGRLDTAAIRRVWPDVLARIFAMRRATWTFVSQHAQVLDYDGDTLVLGIATAGLAKTFRQGNHAELVRQALIDEIGLDARVDGVPPPDAPGPAGAPSDPGGGPRDVISTERDPADEPPDDDGWPDDAGPEARPVDAEAAPFRPAPPEGSILPPQPSGPPPPQQRRDATPSGGTSPGRTVNRERRPEPRVPVDTAAQARSVRDELARARLNAAESSDGRGGSRRGSTRDTDGASVLPVDDGASADDEDLVESGSVGREVIEKILGGRVLGEFEE